MDEKFPIGRWVHHAVEWLTLHFDSQFRFFSDQLSMLLYDIIDGVLAVSPWILWCVIGVSFALLSRSLLKGLLVFGSLYFIENLGYWRETVETVVLVFSATLVSTSIGVPLGILCAHRPTLYRVIRPVLDFMQTIPTFVYLIPTLMLFGLGVAPGLISTVIFAMPASVRLTQLGISEVPLSLQEVGAAFGANSWQQLLRIEIPHALSSIRAGVSQTVMLSLSMVVIAALVGADGLGKPVVQALNTVNIAKGFEAGVVIVIVAVILDRFLMLGSQGVSFRRKASSV